MSKRLYDNLERIESILQSFNNANDLLIKKFVHTSYITRTMESLKENCLLWLKKHERKGRCEHPNFDLGGMINMVIEENKF